MSINEYIESSRIRGARRRKRMQILDSDKKLISLFNEEVAVSKKIGNLGLAELKPPVQQGYIRFFILRPDVRRTKDSLFFEKILQKINTTQWSYRKDFKKKRRKYGKKLYAVREQCLRDIEEWEFNEKFSEPERQCFYETLIHSKNCKKPFKVFRFIESWRFILRVQPNMITKVRIKDLDLERRSADIQRYFQLDNRRNRLWKLLYGRHRWKWHFPPKAKYKDPLANRSLADILDEYLPEPTLRILQSNPRNPGGFSFLLNRSFIKNNHSRYCKIFFKKLMHHAF